MNTHRFAFLICLASCTASHVIGENQNHQAVTCGGVANLPCSGTTVCVDDPADACDPTHGGADCTGLCVQPQGECGGIAGIQCGAGETCVDDPRDSCGNLGADCPGICVVFEPSDAGGCGADPCGSCPAGTTPHDACSGGAWQCTCDPVACGADTCGSCPAGSRPRDVCSNGTWQCDCQLFCGGFANIACPGGLKCVDDPTDSCDPTTGGADCGGVCVAANEPDAGNRVLCAGFASIACPSGFECVDDPTDSCDPTMGGADCGGVCVATSAPDAGSSTFCGGFAQIACPSGLECVDDPYDGCDPHMGGADCGGICVVPQRDGGESGPDGGYRFCGGFAGIPCPGSQSCIDDPADQCDPAMGGADCPGICM